MTREDAVRVLAVIKAAYPGAYKGITGRDANGIVNLWAAQFHTVPADIVMIAVNKLIAVNTFVPTIAEVKHKLSSVYYEATTELLSNRYMSPAERVRYEEIAGAYDPRTMAEPPIRFFLGEIEGSKKHENQLHG